MQFPQINKYESLIERHLRPSFDPLHALSFDAEPLPRLHLADILSDIDEINLARSYHPAPHHTTPPRQAHTPTSPNCAIKSSGSQQTLECDRDLTFFSQRKAKRNTGRSLIFTQVNFSKNKQTRPGDKTVKIYYFNLPLSKTLNYDGNDTVADLIRKALDAYAQDRQMDPARVKDRTLQNYQLRIPETEGSHEADMGIEPISPSRYLADNLFDSLVLLRKEQPNSRKLPLEYTSSLTTTNPASVIILLFNQLGEQLGRVPMGRADSLEQVFTYIQSNDLHQMRNFYLTENQNDEDPLPKDFEIKNLESNRIYIKSKRYIDESQFQGGNRAKIIRSLTLFKEKQPPVPPPATSLPIGLSQASLYEQFSVIKVNNMGVEQQRIIGIDQHKVYNYDRAVREEKRQTSFFSKIFGVNRDTGTKRPYRFISDIQHLTPIEKGFQLVFPDKSIKYYVDSQQTREKIMRKLNYLISYTQVQKREGKS